MEGSFGASPSYPPPLWSQLRLSLRPGHPDGTQAGQADSQRALRRQFLGAGVVEEVRVGAAAAADRARAPGVWFGSFAGYAHRWAAEDQGFGPAAGWAVCPAQPGGLALRSEERRVGKECR